MITRFLRRGVLTDSYHLDIMEPHAIPPWDPPDIESRTRVGWGLAVQRYEVQTKGR